MDTIVEIGNVVIPTLDKPIIANKISAAVEIIASEIVETMSACDNFEDRAQIYLNKEQLLKPKVVKKKVGEKKKKPGKDDAKDTKEENIDEITETTETVEEPAEEEVPDNVEDITAEEKEEEPKEITGYTYYGNGRVKDADKKWVMAVGTYVRKKMVSISLPAKQILQALLSMYAKEIHMMYENNSNSFPFKQDDVSEELKSFSLSESTISISPFIIEVSKLYENYVGEISDEETKGAGSLKKALQTEFNKAFTSPKGGQSIVGKLEEFICIYIKFLKVFTKMFVNICWEQKVPLNQGILLGIIRNLSMTVKTNGGYLEETAYPLFNAYTANIEKNKKKVEKDESKPKKTTTKKTPAKKTPAKKTTAATKESKKADIDEISGAVDSAAKDWEDTNF